MNTILAFKAGRAFRREGTNAVEASLAKGAIVVERERDDELLHFMWKNRETNETEEDLLLFPSDATFERVTQADGRVYVLKFSSSDQRHFFWMQNGSSARDSEFVRHVNNLLRIPGYIPVWDTRTPAQRAAAEANAPQHSAPVPSGSSQPQSEPAIGAGQPTQDQLAQLRTLVEQMSGGPGATSEPELSLMDILTPAVLTPLFTSHPALIPTLFPHLPADLPTSPSPEVISQIVSSPQFRSAVLSFDRALRTGMLGGLVRQLGLPVEAGTGVEAFLRAIAEQARGEGGERMDTD
ncbi:hypothetical protein EW146_g1926 [Bondarzewia mesenterica]|uniref:Uncharacterized protein n=1 Tax=Bondarzewia mesenterica TaxID=1095465 RepID=A0A4S4M2D0_9AGAM|nr:hypothetical protein EW146_g1926 [Bondarzewia mesenterica]